MLVYITAILDIIGEEEEKKKSISIYSSTYIYIVAIIYIL